MLELERPPIDGFRVHLHRDYICNLKTMSPSSPNLAGIPIELLEQILLNLSGQDIVKMEAVRGWPKTLDECLLTLR